MRLLVYILTTGILLFNLQLRGQEINSYNVNAILDVDNKSIEVKQIMKFRNTSNIQLNEIFLEDWSNSYINNETKLAKRISDEYSRSFSFAQKRQRGFTTINNLEGGKKGKFHCLHRLHFSLDTNHIPRTFCTGVDGWGPSGYVIQYPE